MSLAPTAADVHYHHINVTNSRAFRGPKNDQFLVQFEGEAYFVRINYDSIASFFDVFIGHTRSRSSSDTNPDITFSDTHFGEYFILTVAPKLKRCGGRLSIEPKPIGNFPARVTGTHHKFVVGFPDAQLFPRLFRLCNAKKLSIEGEKRVGKATKSDKITLSTHTKPLS